MRAKLQGWALDGSIASAARQALILNGTPDALRDLISQWSAGDFRSLPPVVLLSSAEMRGAMGAYAISTGIVYLNAYWMTTASRKQVLAVLTEELGSHLDGLLNPIDTPGDEGELFSKLLFTSKADLTGIQQQNDAGTITVNGQPVAVELAASSITAPAGTINLTSPNLSYTVNISGTNAGADLLVAAYASNGSFIGWQVVNRSTTFDSLSSYNGTFNFASTAINRVDSTSITLRVWQGTAGSSYGKGSNTTPPLTYGKTTNLVNGTTTGFSVNTTTVPSKTTGAINLSSTTPTAGSVFSTLASTYDDNIAPAATTLNLKTDSGSSATDRITSDGTIVVGGLISGGKWQYSLNSGRTWSAPQTTTATTANLVIPAGTYGITVRQYDAANNVSPNTQFASLTVDATAPTIGTLALGSYTDSGTSTTDRISTDNAFSISLSSREQRSTLIYERSIDGTNYISTAASQSALADGSYWYRAKVTDTAGNITISNAINVQVDRSVTTGALTDSSTAAGFHATSTTFNLGLSGNEAGSNASYERSTNRSTWSTTTQIQSGLAIGKYFYRAKITDVAGNSAYTTVLEVAVVASLLSGYAPSDYGANAIILELATPEKNPQQKLLTQPIGRDNFYLRYATPADPIYLDGRLIDPNTYGNVGISFKYQDKFSTYTPTLDLLFYNDDVFIGTPASDYVEYISGNFREYVSGYSFGLEGQDRLSTAFVSGGFDNDALRGRVVFGDSGDDQMISSTQNKTLDLDNPIDSIRDLAISKSIAHYLNGGAGNDAIFDQFSFSGWYYGGSGDDLIIGSAPYIISDGLYTPKSNEIDWLTGGLGADTFYLSGSSFFPTRPHQDPTTFSYLNGISSYAVVTDFNSSEGDTVQFHQPLKYVQQGNDAVLVPMAPAELFTLSEIKYDGSDAVGIYLKTMPMSSGPRDAIGYTPDLIGLIAGATLTTFSLNNITLQDLSSFVRQPGWTNFI